jgi:hypothetical protein
MGCARQPKLPVNGGNYLFEESLKIIKAFKK